MQSYRLFFFDGAGHIERAHEFEAKPMMPLYILRRAGAKVGKWSFGNEIDG